MVKAQREAMTTNSEEGTERNDEYIAKKAQRNDEYIVKKAQREMMAYI